MSVSVQDVLDAQVHIGTLKNEAHPKTKKYWVEIDRGLVVLNPEIITEQITNAKAKIASAKAEKKEILIVCEKKMYAPELESLSKKAGIAFLNHKVPGGFLTNFDTFKKRLDTINEMTMYMESEDFLNLTKKEQLVYKRKYEKVNKIYHGVVKLTRQPELVIVVDGEMLSGFLDEATHLKKTLDTIVIAGSNFSRYRPEDQLIVSNINSYQSLDFVLSFLLS